MMAASGVACSSLVLIAMMNTPGAVTPPGPNNSFRAFVVQMEWLRIPGLSQFDQLVSIDVECRAKKNVTRLTVLEVVHCRTITTWAILPRRCGGDRRSSSQLGQVSLMCCYTGDPWGLGHPTTLRIFPVAGAHTAPHSGPSRALHFPDADDRSCRFSCGASVLLDGL